MKRFRRISGCVLTVALMLSVNDATRASEPFRLVEDDVVVFLGGTNMLYLQEAGYLEAMLTRAFVESRPKFRDFTWEADTVFRQGTVIER